MLKLRKELLDKHPDLTKKDIKLIATVILGVRADKIRRGYILDFFVPSIGQFRTYRTKKVKRYNKNKVKDRKRKREQQFKKEMSKVYLLY